MNSFALVCALFLFTAFAVYCLAQLSTFAIMLAVTPLAIYCLILGALHSGRKPRLLSGDRNLICLGLSMIGLFLIGPAELFFPQGPFNIIGVSVWIVIIILYLLSLLYAALNARFCLIVYGLEADTLTRHLDQVLQQLDPGVKWLNQTFVAPSLGIQGVVEPAGLGAVSHAIATKAEQNAAGWRAVEKALGQHLRSAQATPDSLGPRWTACGFFLLTAVVYTIFHDSHEVAQGIREMLRF